MRIVFQSVVVLPLLLLAPACGGGDDDGGGSGDPDAGDAPVDADTGTDTAVAVPGARCAAADRVGLVEVTVGKFVRADLYDRPDPWLEEPALSDSACDHHRHVPQKCPVCEGDEICSTEGACEAIPRRDTAGRLVVRAGGDEQTFQADPELGDLGGEITLPGDSFALEVEAFGQVITLEEEMSVPDPLPELAAILTGTYDAPEAIDATWDPQPAGSHLHTLIRINHHAAAPTFTECAADASTGTLTIEEDMLVPLAVSTGLEFQYFDHVRFAAADTARGCVEFRFSLQEAERPEGL